MQILTPCWGHRLFVYERICTYLCRNTCIYELHVYARILFETSISRPDPASSYLHKPTSSTHAAVSVFHSIPSSHNCCALKSIRISVPRSRSSRGSRSSRSVRRGWSSRCASKEWHVVIVIPHQLVEVNHSTGCSVRGFVSRRMVYPIFLPGAVELGFIVNGSLQGIFGESFTKILTGSI